MLTAFSAARPNLSFTPYASGHHDGRCELKVIGGKVDVHGAAPVMWEAPHLLRVVMGCSASVRAEVGERNTTLMSTGEIIFI
jgi:hypothetical protein